MINVVISGLGQGMLWAILALGVFISYRLLDFADLTCEGCITFGASFSAMLIWQGWDPFLSLVIAFVMGCLAGTVTGVLHTKLKIPPILAGILTMISLYSVNIHVMSWASGVEGTANLTLLNHDTSFNVVNSLLNFGKGNTTVILGLAVVALVVFLLYRFFGTEIGSAVRATGTNEHMCRAQGINTDSTKIIGLAISNGLIALAGAMICQNQGYSEVNMGVGSIVIGLASIIIGETLFARAKNFAMKMTGIVVGAIVYRIVVALVIFSGMPSTDLKLMTAVIVTVALSLPIIREKLALHNKRKALKAQAGATEEEA